MTALDAYRDDGPLAGWLARALGPGRTQGRPARLAPPLVRTFEYSALIAIAALADRDAVPFAFAFVAVLAFHHYEIVYRLRHQRLAPPRWVQAIGGGWEIRILAALVLALVGGLVPAFVVPSVVLGIAYAVESRQRWVRSGRASRPPTFDEEPGDDVVE